MVKSRKEQFDTTGGSLGDTYEVDASGNLIFSPNAVGVNTLAEVLATGNTADGYNIDLNSGSTLISSDGTVTVNDDLDVFGDGYIFGNFGISGKLTVDGLIDPTGLVLVEQATVPGGTPTSGSSTIWIRNADGYLIITDELGVDNEFIPGGGGGSQDLNSVLGFGDTTDGLNIELTSGSLLTSTSGATGTALGITAGAGSAGDGGTINIAGGTSAGGGDAGDISITGGSSAASTGDGGNVIITGGATAGATGTSGNIQLTTPSGHSPANIVLSVGEATGTGVAAAPIEMRAGDANDGAGGDITITAGNGGGVGSNDGGAINITGGTGAGGVDTGGAVNIAAGSGTTGGSINLDTTATTGINFQQAGVTKATFINGTFVGGLGGLGLFFDAAVGDDFGISASPNTLGNGERCIIEGQSSSAVGSAGGDLIIASGSDLEGSSGTGGDLKLFGGQGDARGSVFVGNGSPGSNANSFLQIAGEDSGGFSSTINRGSIEWIETIVNPTLAQNLANGATDGTDFTITSQGTNTGNGGSLNLNGGMVDGVTGSSIAGSVNITGGAFSISGTNLTGGSINLTASAGGSSSGSDGNINLDLTSGGVTSGIIDFQLDGYSFLEFDPSASVNMTFGAAAGPITISQTSQAGAGSNLAITAQGSSASTGGNLNLNAGAGTGGAGGDVNITGGTGSVGGSLNLDTGGTDTDVTISQSLGGSQIMEMGLISALPTNGTGTGLGLYLDPVGSPFDFGHKDVTGSIGADLHIISQTSTDDSGGALNLHAGDGGAGFGGTILLQSGTGTTNGGVIDINAGSGSSGFGGDINLNAGGGTSGGDLNLTPGIGSTVNGIVNINGDGYTFGNFEASGEFIASDGSITAPSYTFNSRPGLGLYYSNSTFHVTDLSTDLLSFGVEQINNIEAIPNVVRYGNRAHPITDLDTLDGSPAAAEATGLYIRVSPDNTNDSISGIYIETDGYNSEQSTAIKIIHNGLNDGVFIAGMEASAALETASFKNGSTGFISTCQYNGVIGNRTMGNSVLFTTVRGDDGTGGATDATLFGDFYATRSLGHSFRTRLQDPLATGFAWGRVEWAISNFALDRNHFEIFNQGKMAVRSRVATAGSLTDAEFRIINAFWTGAASVDKSIKLHTTYLGSGDPILNFSFGNADSEVLEATLDKDGLNVFGDGYFDGDMDITGKLTVAGIIDPTGLVLDEQSTVPGGTPAAGKATFWVRDTDGYAMLTDDTGTDTVLNSGGGGGGGTTTGINEIAESSVDGYIEDYDPTGGFDENAIENFIEFDGYVDGTEITGIAAPSQAIRITIVNISTGDLTFLAEDTSSIEANRIIIGGLSSLVLGTNDTVTMIYSTLSSRWRVV